MFLFSSSLPGPELTEYIHLGASRSERPICVSHSKAYDTRTHYHDWVVFTWGSRIICRCKQGKPFTEGAMAPDVLQGFSL